MAGPSPDDLKQLAPTGKLRGGIVVSPAASAFFAIKDGKGAPQGVTIDLMHAFAQALKLPLDLQVYDNSGQVTDAVASGDCDVAFMPRDATREGKVDFGPAYYFIEHLSGAGRLEDPKHRRGRSPGRAHRRHFKHNDGAQRPAHRAERLS